MKILDLIGRRRPKHLVATQTNCEQYAAHVVSLANDLLRPQTFVDPMYGDLQRMAAELGTTFELDEFLRAAFEGGRLAEETALSAMLKGLDYKVQIETAARSAVRQPKGNYPGL